MHVFENLASRRGAPRRTTLDPRRLLWRRSRSWFVAALVALVVGLLTARAVGTSQQVADALGPTLTVPVAARPLEAGHEVQEGDLRWLDWPEGLLASPPGAEVLGRVVTARILAGEPLVEARLAPSGADGSEALSRPGSVQVAVPMGDVRPNLEVGDHVDVLAAGPGGSAAPAGRWVARGAVVLALEDDSAVLAVEPADAASTAGAGLSGPVALVVVSYR